MAWPGGTLRRPAGVAEVRIVEWVAWDMPF